jgi:hypothetical protein
MSSSAAIDRRAGSAQAPEIPGRRLSVGDRVRHEVFGAGEVLGIDRDVARVAFADERRKLVIGSLERVARPAQVPIRAPVAAPPEPKSRHADRIGARIAANAGRLAGRTIVFTGDGPFNPEDLAEMLPRTCRVSIEPGSADRRNVDVLVIGRFRWSPEVVRGVLGVAPASARALPQEGFVDLLIAGYDWWSESVDWLNDVTTYHAGLRMARDVFSFRWPSVPDLVVQPAEPILGSVSDELEDVLRDRSRLNVVGYQISGMTRAQRWDALTDRAVPELGLQYVAEFIATLIRMRRAQPNGARRYRSAITEWKHDLQQLKRTYYDRGRRGFAWPSV